MSNITTEETKKCTCCEKVYPHHQMRLLVRNLTHDGVKIKRYYISSNCKNCYKTKQKELYQKNRVARLKYSKEHRKTSGGQRGKRLNPKFNAPPITPS